MTIKTIIGKEEEEGPAEIKRHTKSCTAPAIALMALWLRPCPGGLVVAGLDRPS